jgi:transposase-like protein
MELRTEDTVMQALASVSRQAWRSNGVHAVAIERAEARTRHPQPKHHCPRCGESAVQPLGSARQSGGAIAHHWECEACEFDWVTFFHALLV